MSYFFRDELNGEFEIFDTLQEALGHAKTAINDLDGEAGWPQEVLDGAFQIGVFTYISQETNRRENDKDDDGEIIDSEFDYLCDIEMFENVNPFTLELEKLQQQNKLLKEAVEFYANKDHWCSWDVYREENKTYHITIADDEEFVDEVLKGARNPYRKYCGGKLARETLSKMKEIQ